MDISRYQINQNVIHYSTRVLLKMSDKIYTIHDVQCLAKKTSKPSLKLYAHMRYKFVYCAHQMKVILFAFDLQIAVAYLCLCECACL